MPRMSKKLKEEWALFLNGRGRKAYNELCRRCEHDYKQSFRAVIVKCEYSGVVEHLRRFKLNSVVGVN